MKLIPIIISVALLFAVGCQTTDGKNSSTMIPSQIVESGEFTAELEDSVSDGEKLDLSANKVTSTSISPSSAKRQPIKISRTIVFRAVPSASGETELRYTDTAPTQGIQQSEERESVLSRSLRYAAIWMVMLVVGYGIFKIYKSFPVAPKPSSEVFKRNVREKDGVVAPVTEPPTKRMREF